MCPYNESPRTGVHSSATDSFQTQTSGFLGLFKGHLDIGHYNEGYIFSSNSAIIIAMLRPLIFGNSYSDSGRPCS